MAKPVKENIKGNNLKDKGNNSVSISKFFQFQKVVPKPTNKSLIKYPANIENNAKIAKGNKAKIFIE